jgi:hypothetical protein
MERPPGINVIAVVFFLFAGYLVAVGAILLFAPDAISIRSTPFMYGRELTGPQSAFLVGAGWALVGWGLYQVRNWARWSALVLLVVGIAASVPAVSAAATDLNWRFAWYGGQLMAKVVAVWYLTRSPEVIDAFSGR